jgi:NAD(P)-dependent dehydrogenase (short-subunit alcohol dehydrogenase family)
MPTYIITGANRGLGLEFVRQLSTTSTTTNPPTIIACVRSLANTDLTALNKLASNPSNGAKITTHELLTSSQESIDNLTKSLPTPTSLPQPLILLNNAGINAIPSQSSLTITQHDLHTHLDVNVLGPAFVTNALLASGHLQRNSLVFNMTSGMGSFGKNIVGDAKTTYAISKAALNMLACHQAKDLEGKGVKVLVMDPGWVKTVSLFFSSWSPVSFFLLVFQVFSVCMSSVWRTGGVAWRG